ncbi:MAG: hypothetical protein PVI80_11735 [Anaerolineae bacterium]|jgi:ribosomal protein L17
MDILDSIKDALGMDDDPEEVAGEIASEGEVFSEPVGTSVEREGDMLETVHASQSSFENLVNKIPGYAGYKAKELRREADKLLRMEIAAKFDDQRKRLAELQHQLISQAQIEFLDDLERAVMKLQLLIDRIKTASYGYAGLFDAVKVKEEQLDALYDFDNQMLNFVDEVAADVDQVSSAITAKEGVGEAISELVSTVSEANMAFGHREEAILQAATY